MKGQHIFKHILVTTLLSLLPLLVWSQELENVSVTDRTLSFVYENLVLLLGGLILAIGIIVIFRINDTISNLYARSLAEAKGETWASEPKSQKARDSMWNWLNRKLTKTVPLDEERDIMFDHEFDGIRELDNSLPPWWVALFYFTIIFGVVYYSYYHFTGQGPSSIEEYNSEMRLAKLQVDEYLASQVTQVDENTVTVLTEAAALESGKGIFVSYCAACHGMGGEGGVGPNMVDKYWVHGGSIQDIFRTIKYGVPEKGMISWQSQLNATAMQEVSSYILTLQGTNPPNQKEPEGTLYEPESEETAEEVPVESEN